MDLWNGGAPLPTFPLRESLYYQPGQLEQKFVFAWRWYKAADLQGILWCKVRLTRDKNLSRFLTNSLSTAHIKTNPKGLAVAVMGAGGHD